MFVRRINIGFRDELNCHLNISSEEIIMILQNIKIINEQEVKEIKSKKMYRARYCFLNTSGANAYAAK